MVLLDVIPYPDYDRHPIRVIRDTIDTIVAPVQQIGDSASGSHGNLTAIILAIIAALTALGICIFFINNYRRRLQRA